MTTLNPGTRVAITQPKWPTSFKSDETTTHYGTVTADHLQPSDDRVPVKIDSGAVILYAPSAVTVA